MDEHGLPYGLGDTMDFLIYNGETVQIDGVSCGLAVLVNGRGGSKMFL